MPEEHNRVMIDYISDPLFAPTKLAEKNLICARKIDKGFILVDGLLHGLVEQNPPITIRKFVKYNLPTLIKQIEKESKEKQSLEH